jgi:cytochrome c-type biogenesis protein CcmH
MTIFWILAAGLLGLALLFVLPPLLAKRGPRRDLDLDQDQINLAIFQQQLQELDADLAADKLDQTQYKAARRDLERELLYDVRGGDSGSAPAGDRLNSPPSPPGRAGPGGVRDRITAVALALALPAGAIALYLYLGDSEIIQRLEAVAVGRPATPAGHPAGADGQVPPLEVLVERLAQKMEQNPGDLKGWLMLGRTYFATNQPDKAQAALEKAYGLAPEDPEVVLSYAQALASNADGKLAGQPAGLIDKALAIDPRNVTGRWLRGLVAYQAADYPGAVERWEGILVDLDPQGKEAQELTGSIAEARSRGGMEPMRPPAAPPAPAVAETAGPAAEAAAPAQAAAASVTVQVSLADALREKADPGHTLFVYAKAVSGPPMPLAVKRLRTSDLPVTVTLDDGMAMMPAMRLSKFPQITVGARISASGQAMPASGDLEGEVSPVEPGQSGPVAVVIDRVRP